jgi:hypothetical protein
MRIRLKGERTIRQAGGNMAEEKGAPGRGRGRLLGSLRDALAAAGKDETRSEPAQRGGIAQSSAGQALSLPPPLPSSGPPDESAPAKVEPTPSAAEAARTARAGRPTVPPIDRHVEFDTPPTTAVLKGTQPAKEDAVRTQLVRGRQPIKRGEFHQDPVVGWFVVVGGPGLGAFRPIYEGNNAIGRSSTQRIPIDFGDEAISSEEQAYVRYDSADRSFLFVPNLAKTNVVSVNNKRPTAAVPLSAMDVITMGRTQLAFVPFCGPEFDWSELDVKT